MGNDNILVTAKEARIMLLIDNTFKYDDMDKARKLNKHIKERNVCQSVFAQNFAKKFENYCSTGIVGAGCPICNAFLEGKGRLLCKNCVEELEKIAEIPEEMPRRKPAVKPVAIKTVEKISAVHEDYELEIEKENESQEEDVINKNDYYVIAKKKLYACIAAAVAVAIIVNFVVAFSVMTISESNEPANIAVLEEPLSPTGHE